LPLNLILSLVLHFSWSSSVMTWGFRIREWDRPRNTVDPAKTMRKTSRRDPGQENTKQQREREREREILNQWRFKGSEESLTRRVRSSQSLSRKQSQQLTWSVASEPNLAELNRKKRGREEEHIIKTCRTIIIIMKIGRKTWTTTTAEKEKF
jgi:hypothetical protein